MRIALRTGGGRGVYELAGRQGATVASDLFGLEIFYELTPEIIIPGRSIAEKRQGKPRIALDIGTIQTTTHVYRLLSAVLLLPKPKREFKTTHGTDLIRFESYSMTVIKVDVGRVLPSGVILRPTDILLENADGLQMQMNVTSRMARIVRLWEAAEQSDSSLAALIRALSGSIRAKAPDYKAIERCAREIAEALHSDGDMLPLAEIQLGATPEQPEMQPLIVIPAPSNNEKFGFDDEISPQEALIQRVKTWRRQVDRGSSGRRFSQAVARAYDYKCLFTGERLPRLQVTDSAGVDSAHILPWSTYDLDSVTNGLCLNKQCHWAFDEGILRIDFDSSARAYIVWIPDYVRAAAATSAFDLGYLNSVTGRIPLSRLPSERSLWPSPTYISELNRYMSTI